MELGIFGDAAGVWHFFVAFREASWKFPRQDHDFKGSRGFPGMELGNFRVAKSSGEGRQPRGNCLRTDGNPLQARHEAHYPPVRQ